MSAAALQIISAQSLSHLKRQHSNILIVDIRPTVLYSDSHINDSISLCVPWTLLKRTSFTWQKIETMISNETDRSAFHSRHSMQAIIFVDSNSEPSQSCFTLAAKLSEEHIDIKHIMYLCGGYLDFHTNYPDQCTDSKPTFCSENTFSICLPIRTNSEKRIKLSPAEEIRYKRPIQIIGDLFISDMHVASDYGILKEYRITCIVNASVECPNVFEGIGDFSYLRLPLEDTDRQALNLGNLASEVFGFIDSALKQRRPVLVHCRAGLSRSVIVIMAYLMRRRGWSLMDAYSYIQTKQERIMPNFGLMGQLLNPSTLDQKVK